MFHSLFYRKLLYFQLGLVLFCRKKSLNLLHIYFLSTIVLDSTTIFSSSFILLLDLHSISEMVFHVMLMSPLYLWNSWLKYVILASRMARFNIPLNTLRLFLRLKYSSVFILHRLHFMYKSSLNFIERIIPKVIHLVLLCLCLWDFTNLSGIYFSFNAIIWLCNIS